MARCFLQFRDADGGSALLDSSDVPPRDLPGGFARCCVFFIFRFFGVLVLSPILNPRLLFACVGSVCLPFLSSDNCGVL